MLLWFTLMYESLQEKDACCELFRAGPIILLVFTSAEYNGGLDLEKPLQQRQAQEFLMLTAKPDEP